MIITRKHLPSPHVPERHGRGHRAADAGRDDAGVRGAGRDPDRRPTRLAFTYVPNGITMPDWTPTAEGAAFEFTRVLKPLEAFRAGHAGDFRAVAEERQRARRWSRRPRARRRLVPDRRPPAQDRGRRHPERHLGRSDRGAAPRRPDALPLARARLRRLAHGRQLRLRLLAAPTRTAWRGADRRRRCRRRRTRGSSSSGCSATSIPASRRRSRARRLQHRRSILDLVVDADDEPVGRSRDRRTGGSWTSI